MEYIYSVETLQSQGITPSKNVSLNVLSKGVYSAQVMKVMQEEPILLSSFGGFAGKSIKHYLDKAKIKTDIVWTDYETPHQVHILLEKTATDYTLQSSEAFEMDTELTRLTYKLRQHIKKVSTLVLSGQLPQGQRQDIFKEWIALARQHNVKVIASTSQKEVWDSFKEEKPYAVLLTEEQLKRLGFSYADDQQLVEQLLPYIGGGLHYIGIYLKNRGAYILSRNNYCVVRSSYHLVNQNNTASSGAFLGAMAIGINRQYEQEKMAKFCLAAALAVDDNVMHKICTRKEIELRYKKTKVKAYAYHKKA